MKIHLSYHKEFFGLGFGINNLFNKEKPIIIEIVLLFWNLTLLTKKK